MPEFPDKLSAVLEAQRALHAAEREADELVGESRERFRQALREAHKAGASYGLLGRVVGLSRQRVARIVSG